MLHKAKHLPEDLQQEITAILQHSRQFLTSQMMDRMLDPAHKWLMDGKETGDGFFDRWLRGADQHELQTYCDEQYRRIAHIVFPRFQRKSQGYIGKLKLDAWRKHMEPRLPRGTFDTPDQGGLIATAEALAAKDAVA